MMLPASDPAAHAVGSARTIKAGDLVVVYEGYNSMKYVYVDPKASFANRYATFFHRVRGSETIWRRLTCYSLSPTFSSPHVSFPRRLHVQRPCYSQ